MRSLILAAMCLTSCASEQSSIRFRRAVESVDFNTGVDADQYGTHGTAGARITFRDPDRGYAK